MAQFESIATATGAAGTNRACSAPSGIASGDMLICAISQTHDENGGSIGNMNTLSGWTSIVNQQHDYSRYHVFYRVADGSEGSTITFTHNGAGTPQNWAMTIARFSSVGAAGTPSGQLNGSATGATGSTTSHVCPTITTTGANSLLVNVVFRSSGWQESASYTPPGGQNERADVNSTNSPYPNFVGLAVGDELIAAASATGTRTWTANAATQGYGYSIELTNSAGGGSTNLALFQRNNLGNVLFNGLIQ